MTSWLKSSMESFYPDDVSGTMDCEVVIKDRRISVSYREDFGWTTYTGTEHGAGHYELKCEKNGGWASLHKSKGAERLEGGWKEGGYHGMWRIDLGDGAEN